MPKYYFSLEKYKKWCKTVGMSSAPSTWAEQCDGEEIRNINILTERGTIKLDGAVYMISLRWCEKR